MTGKTITQGYVYYAQSHQRELVEITEVLRRETLATIEQVKQLIETGIMPKPIYSKRCKGCSLYAHCLPQAAEKLQRYKED